MCTQRPHPPPPSLPPRKPLDCTHAWQILASPRPCPPSSSPSWQMLACPCPRPCHPPLLPDLANAGHSLPLPPPPHAPPLPGESVGWPGRIFAGAPRWPRQQRRPCQRSSPCGRLPSRHCFASEPPPPWRTEYSPGGGWVWKGVVRWCAGRPVVEVLVSFAGRPVVEVLVSFAGRPVVEVLVSFAGRPVVEVLVSFAGRLSLVTCLALCLPCSEVCSARSDMPLSVIYLFTNYNINIYRT